MTGAELKSARLDLTMTQAELGEALDLSGTHIGQMERGAGHQGRLIHIERRTAMAVQLLLLKHNK